MAKLSAWSKTLDVQLHIQDSMTTEQKSNWKSSAEDTPRHGLSADHPSEASTASMAGDDATSITSTAVRRPRVRSNRRAKRTERQKGIADVSRVLAREAARATEMEMGSLPLDIFPLLEEEFEMSDGDSFLDSSWCDGYSVPDPDASQTGDTAGASTRGIATQGAGVDCPTCTGAFTQGPLLLVAASPTLDQGPCTILGSLPAGTDCHTLKRKREEHDMYQGRCEEDVRDCAADGGKGATLATSIE